MHYIIVFVIAFLIISFGKKFLQTKNEKKSFLSENDTLDEQFNANKRIKQLEIDQILDKVAKNGIDTLSKKERKKLDEYSSKS